MIVLALPVQKLLKLFVLMGIALKLPRCRVWGILWRKIENFIFVWDTPFECLIFAQISPKQSMIKQVTQLVNHRDVACCGND